MRIAFITPWFRNLSHLYGRILQDAGHEILIATTDRSFEHGYGLCREAVAAVRDTNPLVASGQISSVKRQVVEFKPDVTFEEVLRDVRWLGGGRADRRVVMVHDARPHDDAHRVRGLRQWASLQQLRSASHVLCFSEATADTLRRDPTHLPVTTCPLISEMPDERVAVHHGSRSGFFVIGRISPYKGLDLALRFWQKLPKEARDENPLIAFLSDDQSGALNNYAESPGVELNVGRFTFEQVSARMAASRAVLLPYRAASQSGAQLMAMQHAVVPLVSPLAGLVEYQPQEMPAMPLENHDLWGETMKRLCDDGDLADQLGLAAREHYVRVTSADRVLNAFAQVLGA